MNTNPSAGELSADVRARFDAEIAKYPAEHKQSAVMGCLAILQQERGWISPESERQVADYLGMTPIAVHEVTTFYNMYNQRPVGKFKINICTNVPCMFRGAGEALARLCDTLKIKPDQTTEDGMFTVQPCECLGACGDAPVMLVNDRTMCSFMTDDRMDNLIAGLRQVKD